MDNAALLAIAVREVGDELGLKLQLRARRAILRRNDAGDLAARKFDNASLGLDSVGAGNDLDCIRPNMIPAQPISA